MRPLVVLRPEPGASATLAAAREIGLEAIAAPLFVVRAVAWTPPAERPDAVLMTSAHAARLGGRGLAALTALPLYAVGAATAVAARAAGFARVVAGDGDVDAIVARARAEGVGTLLHIAGREHRVPEAASGIARRIVYAADAVAALPALPADPVVLLHSPRAAARFSALTLDRSGIAIVAISAAALSAAGTGWAAAVVAERPSDPALLAAAAKLCDQGRRS